MRSLNSWCVFSVDSYAELSVAHDVMNPGVLERALGLLSAAVQPNPEKLAACRSAHQRELTGQLGEAEALLAQNKRDDARQKLMNIDAHFGGLASPRSVVLFNQLGGR